MTPGSVKLALKYIMYVANPVRRTQTMKTISPAAMFVSISEFRASRATATAVCKTRYPNLGSTAINLRSTEREDITVNESVFRWDLRQVSPLLSFLH